MGGCAISSLPSSESMGLPPQKPQHPQPRSPSSVQTSSMSAERDLLTDVERKVVLETWSVLLSSSGAGSATQETGVRILLRFFELAPDAKNAFPSFRDLEESAIPRNLLFRSHALRFMRAIEAVMINIDLLELTVIPNLLSLGRRHACIDGFKAKYLGVLEDAMIDVWKEVIGERFDRTSRKAWTKVFRFIAEQMFQGVQQQTQQQQRLNDSKDQSII